MSQFNPGEFNKVDHSASPTEFVNYLERASALRSVIEWKQLGYQLQKIKEGNHILDVGCGLGDDVRAMAKMVGSGGRVVGIDNSAVMIEQARAKPENKDWPVEFEVADVNALPFDDGTFDSCLVSRVFIHFTDPLPALREMVRVTKPGGMIVILEGDFGQLVVDSSNREVTRKILNFNCDSLANGWIGHQLVGLFKRAGLVEVNAIPRCNIFTEFGIVNQQFSLQKAAEGAAKAGLITEEESTSWLNELKQLEADNLFLASVVGWTVVGRRPE